MAKPQMPGPWIERLVEERTALRDRALSTLQSNSQQRCTTLAQQVLDAQLRQPVSEGAFDDVEITVFEEAVRSALSQYDIEAAGPAKADVAVEALAGKPLLDVFGTLQRRLQQQLGVPRLRPRSLRPPSPSFQRHRPPLLLPQARVSLSK